MKVFTCFYPVSFDKQTVLWYSLQSLNIIMILFYTASNCSPSLLQM